MTLSDARAAVGKSLSWTNDNGYTESIIVRDVVGGTHVLGADGCFYRLETIREDVCVESIT